MTEKFDIIEYLSGLTSFVLDRSVLERIAIERGVSSVEMYDELESDTRDLLRADILYAVYLSPNIMAGSTKAHGGYTKTIGGQSVYADTKRRIYGVILGIYKKYDDPKYDELVNLESNLQFIDDKFGL